MIDSNTAQVIHDTIYVHSAEALEMMAKTHDFYDSAWDRLIQVIIWSFAIIGIAMPIAIQIYQRGRFSLMKKSLRRNIKKEFDIEIKTLSKKMKKKSKRMNARSMAGVFFLQGTNSFEKGDYERAYIDYYFAVCDFHFSKDYSNVRSSIICLEDTIRKLDKATIKSINDSKSFNVIKTFNKIKKDKNSHIYLDVEKFKSTYADIMKQGEFEF